MTFPQIELNPHELPVLNVNIQKGSKSETKEAIDLRIIYLRRSTCPKIVSAYSFYFIFVILDKYSFL